MDCATSKKCRIKNGACWSVFDVPFLGILFYTLRYEEIWQNGLRDIEKRTIHPDASGPALPLCKPYRVTSLRYLSSHDYLTY